MAVTSVMGLLDFRQQQAAREFPSPSPSAGDQGATLGVTQSVGSLARIAGPLFAATLFALHPSWPYVACAAMALLTFLIVLVKLLPSLRRHAAA